MGREHLYAVTSAAYPPKAGEKVGVEVEDGNVEKVITANIGSGAYLIGSDGELRGKDAGAKIWAHTMKTFENVRGSRGRSESSQTATCGVPLHSCCGLPDLLVFDSPQSYGVCGY